MEFVPAKNATATCVAARFEPEVHQFGLCWPQLSPRHFFEQSVEKPLPPREPGGLQLYHLGTAVRQNMRARG